MKTKQDLVQSILEEIKYTPNKFGGSYKSITIPELITLSVNRTMEYASTPEHNPPLYIDGYDNADLLGSDNDMRRGEE